MMPTPIDVLIACNRHETSTALEQMLQEPEYRTIIIGDNMRAIDGLKARNFHMAIFDLAFLEAYRDRILEHKNNYFWIKAVPTIIVISQDGISNAVQWLDWTASDFLIEPLHSELLKVRLHHCLANQRYANGVNEFFGGLSHDIMSPLASIRGYTELLLGGYSEKPIGPLNEKQTEFLHTIERYGYRMQRLIEAMRDHATIENGEVFIDFMPTPLKSEVEDAIAFVQSDVSKRFQILNTHIPDDLPVIQGQPWRLQQALRHVFENASHYTPNYGQIDITVEYLAGPNAFSNSAVIYIATKDTGIGIPAEEQERVFTLYWRSRSIYLYDLPRTEGIGFGLYITKAIVEAHGGQIWFESVQGEGSTFHLTLPVSS